MSKLRIALIGYGYWGPKLAATFARLDGAELAMIADLAAERRAAARKEHPAAIIVDGHEAALRAEIDALVVATPAASHSAIAVAALEAGKHVMVEKPLAPSLTEVDRIAAAAAKHGRIVFVGHTFEYHPAVEALGRLIGDGVLGRLRYVRSTRASLGRYQPDVDVLWDLAVHDVSILLAFGQMPVVVHAHGLSVAGQGCADVAWLQLAFANGLAAQVHVSWTEPVKQRRMIVVGDRRMAVFDESNGDPDLWLFDSAVERCASDDPLGLPRWLYRRGDAETVPLRREEPLFRECRHFVDCVVAGLTPNTGLASGRRVVAVLEAAARSMGGAGAPMEVESPAR